MIKTRAVAILETMWGGTGHAPGLFRINPDNFTGRRLYWFLGHRDLWCTNASPEYVISASQHGTPNPRWLAKNLQRITYNILLVCGKVAQKTFEQCKYRPKCRIIELPHPAARVWTRADLDSWKELIQSGAH